MKRIIWALALSAMVVLGGAAVWLGALNQDEGWYLYAANLVSEGQLPYRDFFFTQGPVMPIAYSAFTWIWNSTGLLGARVLTLAFGVLGILFAVAVVRRIVPEDRKNLASLLVVLLLGGNLYHLYYLAIPKTYALSSVFVAMGFYLVLTARRGWCWLAVLGGLSLALAAGTRLSLGMLLAVVAIWLIVKKDWRSFACFSFGGALGLAITYGPFLLDCSSFSGLVAAQQYHAARQGGDIVWIVGSFSRLVRWYFPVFVLLGMWIATGGLFNPKGSVLAWGFLAVFVLQMIAPFPYEDYQVPVMGILAIFAAANIVTWSRFDALHLAILVMAMVFAGSFGSPLLEKWMTNGQDRFWSIKKEKCELAQLQEVAREIELLDPNGRDLFTQDLYLAIETGRKVPKGLEMGPFSILSDSEWKDLIASAPCKIAAMSGYTFAIEPPSCKERPMSQQMEYWKLLKQRYELIGNEPMFGQNATSLLLLRRK